MSNCILVLLVLVALLPGCTVNPVTGERELSLVSPEQEVALGAANYGPSQQAQGGRYYLDPELQVYVASVGSKLAAVSDRPRLPYEFVVLNNPVPNAWALPGGKIAINSGLLLYLQDEAQLAAVLSHEIVHAAARHGASQMSRGTLINLGAQVAAMASQSAGYGDLGSVAQLGAAAWMARYGREDELESDQYGMDYMVRAGYDPEAAVELQETFVQLSQNQQQDFVSGLFASHPPSAERVARNRQKARTLPKGGVRNQANYQRRISQLRKDQPVYKAQEAAVAALKNKDARTALILLDGARDLQPRDSYTWELRGHAWRLLEQNDKAEQAFTTAISKNPDYYSPYLSRGVLRYAEGDQSAARSDLEKSLSLLPTPAAGYYLGEISAAAGKLSAAIKYFQLGAQSSGSLGKQARSRLVRLELEESPHKYIPSRVFLGEDGYLKVLVQNTSGITVSDVRVRLTEMENAFVAGNSTELSGPVQMASGARAVISTGIGPFADSRAASRYQVRVIAARPAS